MTQPSRDRRVLVLGWAITTAGDFLALTALLLAAHDTTSSSWAVAGVLVATLLPQILFARRAGRLVDTSDPARLIAGAAIAQAVIVTSLAAWATELPVTLGLAFAFGLGAVVIRPAVFVLIPRLTPRDKIAQANGHLQAARFLGIAGGQAAGGVLVATAGVPWALLVDAASFLVLAALLLTVHPAPLTQAPAPARGRPRGGLAILTADPALLAALVVSGTVVLAAGATNVAEVFFAKDALGAGDTGFGLLVASWAVGLLIGLTILARRLGDDQLLGGLLGAAVVAGVAIYCAAASPNLPAAMVAYLAGGMANGVAQVAVMTLIHNQVDQEAQGRAYASFGAVMSTAELTALLFGGTLIQVAGARGTMAISGTAMIVVVVTAALLLVARRARALR